MKDKTEYTDIERTELYHALNVGDEVNLTDAGMNRDAKVIKKNPVMVIIKIQDCLLPGEDPITYFFKDRISWN